MLGINTGINRFGTTGVGGPGTRLNILLRSDGYTVADYNAALGVTGTLNASAWANQMGIAGPLLQATGAAQPIVLPFTGAKYAYLPGVAGNYFSTPLAAANRITGDIAIVVSVAFDDWTPTATQIVVSKLQTAGQYSYDLYINGGATGLLQARVSTDGTALISSTSTAAPAVSDGAKLFIAFTRSQTNGDFKFFTSTDGISFTQLGDTVAGATGAIFDGNTGVGIGAQSNGANAVIGKLYSAKIYNGVPPMLGYVGSATPVVDWNAADWPETSTNGATQASSTTGEVWTLNNTGEKLAQIVGSSSLLFDGTASYMQTAAFTLNVPLTIYAVINHVTWSLSGYLIDGASAQGMSIYSTTVTPKISQTGAADANENSHLTLNAYHVLSSGFYASTSNFIKVDSNAATTGANSSSVNPGGITLAAPYTGDVSFSGNIQVKELIIRNIADSATTQARIQSLLKSIYGTP